MSQIRDKKAHRKRIATMNPINAKSVQLIELHAFAYRLLSVYLSESFDFFKSKKHCKSNTYVITVPKSCQKYDKYLLAYQKIAQVTTVVTINQ